jgi:hypothetical protein
MVESTPTKSACAPRRPEGRLAVGAEGRLAVNHELGAATTGGVADVVGGEPVRLKDLLRARPLRHLERLRPAVDGHDETAAQRPQQLDGGVAEAADSDYERGRAGPQPGQRALDRVVRVQCAVGQRRRGHRVEVADRDREPYEDHDVFGQAAVRPIPGAVRPARIDPTTAP